MKYQRVLDANNTFKLIAEEWGEHNLGKWSKNHAGTVRRRLGMDIRRLRRKAVRVAFIDMKLENHKSGIWAMIKV